MASSTAIKYAASRSIHYEDQTLTSGKSICKINSDGYCQIRVYNATDAYEFEIFNTTIVFIRGVSSSTVNRSFAIDNKYLISSLSGNYNIDIESLYGDIEIDTTYGPASYSNGYLDKNFTSAGNAYTTLTYETNAGLKSAGGVYAKTFTADNVKVSGVSTINFNDMWKFTATANGCTVSLK